MTQDNNIELAAEIVSAYVSNNSVPAGDLPSLINEVYGALTRVGAGGVAAAAPVGGAQARGPGEKVRRARFHYLPRRRKEIQIPEAPSAHAIWSLAGRLPREMGLVGGLSDGRAELRQGALQSRQADGAWAAAPPPRRREVRLHLRALASFVPRDAREFDRGGCCIIATAASQIRFSTRRAAGGLARGLRLGDKRPPWRAREKVAPRLDLIARIERGNICGG